MPLFSYSLFLQGTVQIEQENVQAKDLWHMLRVLAGDCKEELEECDRLEIWPSGLKPEFPKEDLP